MIQKDAGCEKAAAEEIRNYQQYDYVLVNDRLDQSTGTLASIVKAGTSAADTDGRSDPADSEKLRAASAFVILIGVEKNSFMSDRRTTRSTSFPTTWNASTYRFIIVAAKRARQLQSGAAQCTAGRDIKKPTMLSMEEVRRGLVPYTDAQR